MCLFGSFTAIVCMCLCSSYSSPLPHTVQFAMCSDHFMSPRLFLWVPISMCTSFTSRSDCFYFLVCDNFVCIQFTWHSLVLSFGASSFCRLTLCWMYAFRLNFCCWFVRSFVLIVNIIDFVVCRYYCEQHIFDSIHRRYQRWWFRGVRNSSIEIMFSSCVMEVPVASIVNNIIKCD